MSPVTAGDIICGAVSGTELGTDERAFMQKCPLAGVTLFKRNISSSHDNLKSLNKDLRALMGADALPILAIDQEGGRVARIKGNGFPDQGPAMELAGGEATPEALARVKSYGAELASALKSFGINVNFAPVVDVLTEPSNVAIGDRAFGTDVEPVCSRSGAFLDGMQNAGVLGCLKHFPGQGDAFADTHEKGTSIDLPRTTLDERELVPFRAQLSKVQMVMMSHCRYPKLSPKEASRSPEIIQGLLRGEMGYEGVVVSDDMNMKAIPQSEVDWQQALVEAVLAGVDLLLVCEHLDKIAMAHRALTAESQSSPTFRKRMEEAAHRVRALRAKLS